MSEIKSILHRCAELSRSLETAIQEQAEFDVPCEVKPLIANLLKRANGNAKMAMRRVIRGENVSHRSLVTSTVSQLGETLQLAQESEVFFRIADKTGDAWPSIQEMVEDMKRLVAFAVEATPEIFWGRRENLFASYTDREIVSMGSSMQWRKVSETVFVTKTESGIPLIVESYGSASSNQWFAIVGGVSFGLAQSVTDAARKAEAAFEEWFVASCEPPGAVPAA